jgi:iron(III) transport system permease protein
VRHFLNGERVLWLLISACVVAIVLVPLVVSLDSAFHVETRFGLSDQHSLASIIDVYTGSDYLEALGQTLMLSAAVTVLCLAAGVASAILMARTDLPCKGLLELLIIMPLFASPFTGLMAWISLGSAKTGFLNIAMATALHWAGIDHPPVINVWSYGGAVWVMFLFFMPFVYLFTVGSMRSMDNSLEEAARSNGASPLQSIMKVTIPLALPSILVAGLAVFVLTAETYTIPGIVGTNAGFTVLSWQIFQDAAGPTLQQAHAAAAATMLLIVAIAGIVAQRYITRLSSRFVTVSGKGFRGAPMRLGRWKWAALLFIGAYILAASLLPFAALLISSLLRYSTSTITLDMFTLVNYKQFLNGDSMGIAMLNTVGLAVGAGVLCVIGGLVISFMDVRRPSFATKLVAIVSAIPVAVPGIVYGMGILWVFLRTPLYGSIWVLLLAYVAKFIPFGVVMSRGGLQQLHPDLENSARMSGATSLQTLRMVTLPLMRLTLVSTLFCVVLLCIKELSASVLLYTTNSNVLSVLTWQYMDSGNYQYAAAVGVVQTLVVVGLVLITRSLFGIKLERTMGRSSA